MGKLLHIGYSKTGTTTLQKHILPLWGAFLGKHGEQTRAVQELTRDLVLGRPPSLQLPERDILSYEVLLSPGNLIELAQRTSQWFSHPTVLVTIRRQDNLIWSRFVHDLQLRTKVLARPVSLNERLRISMEPCFFPFCDSEKIFCPCGDSKVLPLPFYNFKAVHDVYSQYFKVLVLPMEWMIQSPQEFADVISDQAGLPKIDLPEALPKENSMEKADRQDMSPVLDLFKESNRALQAHCPVDLKQWGYY